LESCSWTDNCRPLDTLAVYETAAIAVPPVRYGVRQVLDQEYQKNMVVLANSARQARFRNGNPEAEVDASLLQPTLNSLELLDEKTVEVKKDFFGRVVREIRPLAETTGNALEGKEVPKAGGKKAREELKIWVTYHEGYSNAVRKPITVQELLKGL